jgi:ubiquinone/menaquinone biosynthesis C-methylase UbiE
MSWWRPARALAPRRLSGIAVECREIRLNSACGDGGISGVQIDRDILEHYEQGVERDRLTTWGRLEKARTQDLLSRFLPPAPANVIDVGGGEGVYALPLAAGGYHVQLIDPVQRHVDAARAAASSQPYRSRISVHVGDARNLHGIDTSSVDAVLMLGPLYHLIGADDRAQALDEAHRVLRPSGVVLVAAISRFASALDGLRTGAIHDPRFEAIVDSDLHHGVHRNPDIATRPEWFTLAYFHRPEELCDEVIAAGFVDVQVLAIEGPIDMSKTAALDDDGQRATILRTIARIEGEPSLLGASPHLLAIGLNAPTSTPGTAAEP